MHSATGVDVGAHPVGIAQLQMLRRRVFTKPGALGAASVGICWEVVASWRLFVQTEDALDLVLVERLRIRMEVVMGGTGLQHGDAADRSAL